MCGELLLGGKERPQLLSPGEGCLCLVCSAPGEHLHKICKALLAWIDWCVSVEIKFNGSSWRAVLPLIPSQVCCIEKYIVRNSLLNSQFNSVYPSKLIGLPDLALSAWYTSLCTLFGTPSGWWWMFSFWRIFCLSSLMYRSYLSNSCIFCSGELHQRYARAHILILFFTTSHQI